MLLKKLELFGFKSFAGKTVLEFEPGITAIVGPNGCGKSNIVDAIKWVLGEQSAKELRGSSMEDVIFNGTETQEHLNFAEVSLQISNEDGNLPIEFTEVIITRRLFRTGESEYLINKTPVRLRDIQELIAGSGIGTKAYSLMEQGKIDLILSSKPEERRFVFEEASGITKFKNKKREALRKLEHTEENLLRISDIISEVRRQISSLERQARRAERYKRLYEELKEKEIQMASFQIKKIQTQLSSRRLQKQEKERVFSSVEVLLKEKEMYAKDLRESISQLSGEIAEAENALREMRSRYQRNQEKIDWNKDTIAEGQMKIELLQQELKEIQERRAKIQEKIDEINREKNNFQKEEEDLRTQIEHKREELSRLDQAQDSLKKEIDSLKSKVLELNFELTQKKNLLLELESEIKTLRPRITRLTQEQREVLSQIEEGEAEITALTLELQKKTSRLKEFEEGIERLIQEKEGLLGKKHHLEEELKGIEKEMAVLDTRLSSWREIYTQRLSYFDEIKSLLDQGESNFIGMLSEILKGSPERLISIELAYKPYLDALVVRTKEGALKLLEFCKEKGFSNLNIIILEQLPEPEFKNLEGATSVGTFIEINPEYKSLLSLIENIFYVPKLEQAYKLSLKFPEFKFITETNIMLERGKITIGLNPSQDLGYIDREGKIERLKDSIQKLRLNFEEKTQKINGLEKEISEKEKILKEKEKECQDLTHELIGIRKTFESSQINKEKLLQEKEILSLEIEEVKKQLDNDVLRQERLSSEINERESALTEVENKLSFSQRELSQVVESKHSYSIQITQLEAKISSFNERREQFLSLENSLLAELDNLTADLNRREQEYTHLFSKIGELEQEIKSLEREDIELEKNIGDIQRTLETKKEKYEEEKSKFEREEDGLIDIRNRYTLTKDELHEIELKMNEEEYKIRSIKDRLSQRYNIYNLPETELTSQISEDVLKGEITKLQEKLNTMGEVNLVAIEEHKKLEERLSFLENQEKDLLEAKESLVSAIRRINKTTRQMFSQTFQEARGAFKEIFPRLFGGGDADLILEEGVDCLEAGIEILARPPGKKLQSVNLLSGGEKALTALALLFAIFKVKPSPFCILDEVDAPLDESNIDRFRKLLEEFARVSQFLVITHNKRTISTADVIYGITMEETGISKIVSVKFQKVEEVAES